MKKFKQTNMKDLLPKLMSAFNLAKGKKPVVIILSIVAVASGVPFVVSTKNMI